MKKNHYEKLGVLDDASPDEIKRAYRAKSKVHHPDKGGDTAEFAEIAKAFEVLSNPERRLLYDATGQDARPPIEIEVQNTLLPIFGQVVAADQDVPVIETVRRVLSESLAKIPEETKKLKARKKVLEAKRSRIESSGKVNFVHLVIDSSLTEIEAKLARYEHDTEIAEACLAALKDYSEDWEAPKRQPSVYFDQVVRAHCTSSSTAGR